MSNTFVNRPRSCSICFKSIFEKKDSAVSGHRAHAHYLAKGGNLKKCYVKYLEKRMAAQMVEEVQCI